MFDRYHVYVILAVIVLGIAKTGFGGGIGILSILLMALVMPAEQMIAVMAVLLVVVDVVANLHYLGTYEWSVLKWMLPGGVFGVAVGTAAFLLMRGSDPASFNRHLSLTIGLICLIFVLVQCYRLTGRTIPTLPPNPANGFAIGAVAGGVSTVSHSAGPIIMLYLLQERLEKRRLVGTMLIYTLLINCAKMISYVTITHSVTLVTIRQCLWMMPFLPAGTLLGVWMNRRLPEKPFVIIMYVASAVTAAEMIYKAVV